MKTLILVGCQSGQKKDGSGTWNRVSLRSASGGIPKEFFVSDRVARIIREENLDMQEVLVTLGFDDYLRPEIVSIESAKKGDAKDEFTADDF